MTDANINIEQLLAGELEPLLVSALDNKASDAEFALLVESLRDSEELRKRASLFLCDESLLSDEIGTTQRASKLVEKLSLKVQQEQSVGDGNFVQTNKTLPFRMLRYVNSHGLAVAALALLAIVGLLTQYAVMMSRMSRLHSLAVQGNSQGEVEVVVDAEQERETGPRIVKGTEVVGRVIGLNDIQWPPNEAAIAVGDSLNAGQRVQIATGVLEILLANGAKVTAEGPVDFEVSSLLEMDLEVGKVVAAVPRTARGYTIMTPTSEVVDIGTQFGLAVAESGDTEVHVFDGDVVARSRMGNTDAELIHASENEAIRFDKLSDKPQRFAAREMDFIRRLAPEMSAGDLPPIPKTDGLSLWYSADVIPNTREGDSISIWRDILVGDNRYANDARQFDSARCPTFTIDDKGRSALRFNGSSTSLMVDPLDIEDRCTVFVACIPGPTSFADGHHGGMLFKYGERPSLELSVLPDFSARGWVWPGPDGGNVGVVNSRALLGSQIAVVAYRYDSAESHSQLWVNGVLQGEANAPVELRDCAHAYLGSHCDLGINAFFFGSIYEIAVYDEPINEDAMDDLSSYFVKRYAIDYSP